MLSKFFIAICCLVPFTGLSSQTEVTDEFINDFTEKFTNRWLHGTKKWDHTKSNISFEIIGKKLTDRIGDVIIAKGRVKASHRTRDEGRLVLLDMPIIHGITKGGTFLLGKVKMDFRYEGETTADKYIHPGHVWVESPWDELHPKGTIHIVIESNYGTNVKINVYFTADEDWKDRPGQFARELAENLKSLAEESIRSFAKANSVHTEIVMKD